MVKSKRSFGPDVYRLFRKLVLGYYEYFSHDLLNSEGRKVFEEAVRMLIYEHPEYKPLITKARRKPTLENVLKVVRLVLGEDEVKDLLDIAIHGVYKYRV